MRTYSCCYAMTGRGSILIIYVYIDGAWVPPLVQHPPPTWNPHEKERERARERERERERVERREEIERERERERERF